MIDNLDEVKARSVPKQFADERSESDIGQSSSTLVSAASSIHAQRQSPSVGSGVIPPASYDIVDGFDVNEPPNTYQTNRYCFLQILFYIM